MRKILFLISIALITACSQGLSEEEAENIVSEAVASAISENTSTSSTNITTTSSTTTTTTSTTTTTTSTTTTTLPENRNPNLSTIFPVIKSLEVGKGTYKIIFELPYEVDQSLLEPNNRPFNLIFRICNDKNLYNLEDSYSSKTKVCESLLFDDEFIATNRLKNSYSELKITLLNRFTVQYEGDFLLTFFNEPTYDVFNQLFQLSSIHLRTMSYGQESCKLFFIYYYSSEFEDNYIPNLSVIPIDEDGTFLDFGKVDCNLEEYTPDSPKYFVREDLNKFNPVNNFWNGQYLYGVPSFYLER